MGKSGLALGSLEDSCFLDMFNFDDHGGDPICIVLGTNYTVGSVCTVGLWGRVELNFLSQTALCHCTVGS